MQMRKSVTGREMTRRSSAQMGGLGGLRADGLFTVFQEPEPDRAEATDATTTITCSASSWSAARTKWSTGATRSAIAGRVNPAAIPAPPASGKHALSSGDVAACCCYTIVTFLCYKQNETLRRWPKTDAAIVCGWKTSRRMRQVDDVQLRANIGSAARDQCASGRIRPLSVLSGMFCANVTRRSSWQCSA
jgi:hypothetical protein